MTARRLGVNIDHIATLRQARGESYPDPAQSLPVLAQCGVEQVTVHLREDRRHIQDFDLQNLLREHLLPVNMELALSEEVLGKALRYKPQTATFVPEKRREVTTEGGLDVLRSYKKLDRAVQKLRRKNISVSLFIEPDKKQIRASRDLGVEAIEIHTGRYAGLVEKFYAKTGSYNWDSDAKIEREWRRITEAACEAQAHKLKVCAGHGLHIHNLPALVRIPEIIEYNIGHAIVARAVFVGLKQAIQEIQNVLNP